MERSLGEKINIVSDITNFMYAGNAWFALKSLKTGTVFQYRLNKSKSKRFKNPCWWLTVRNGNITGEVSKYELIGKVYDFGIFPIKQSYDENGIPDNISKFEGIEFKAFVWFWNKLNHGELPNSVEFYHIGRCGRCGHKLTDPKSIAIGLGPICRKR